MAKLVLWVDDLRDPPNRPGEEYMIVNSVNEAKRAIEESEIHSWREHWEKGICVEKLQDIDIIDLDHDAGIYAPDGGDYINILNYLEARAHAGYKIKCVFRIHSFNPVGVTNMRAIIERNGWKEVY